MEFGVARGLAVDLQYQARINDARFYDQQLKRAQAENAAELTAFEDDLDYMNANNSYDHNLIKEESNKTIGEIGNIIRDNHDWRVNPDVRRQINEKKKYLKSNQNVIRGMASDEAFKQMNKDLAEVAKNPEFHNSDAYQELLSKKQNYLKYGHQDGTDGLKRDGGPQTFVYDKPRDFRDLNKDFASIGNDFKDVLQKDIKGGGRGGYQEYSNPQTLGVIANQYYSQNKVQLDKEAAKVNMDPLAYTMQGIDAHIKKQRHLGDFGLQDAMTLRAIDDRKASAKAGVVQGRTTWDTEIKGKDNGQESGDVLDQILGKEYTYNVMSRKGDSVEISGYESKHTGQHRYMEVVGKDGKKHKQKFVEIYTDMPESASKEKGFTYDPWGFGDNDVKDDYKDKVSKYTREGKDGKSQEITRVKTWVPVDVNNQAFRGRYDKMNMASKYQQGTDESAGVDTTGWTSDPDTGEVFDAQGNKRGTVDNYK